MALFAAIRRRLAERIGGEALQGALRQPLLADAMGDVVMRLDGAGDVLSASGRMFNVFGLEPEKLVGRGFLECVHLEDRQGYLALVAEAARGGAALTATFRLRRGPDAATEAEAPHSWAEMRAFRFPEGLSRRADDAAATIICVLRDVTRAKSVEASLQSARAEAELANSWKDRLLANVSHELRTPLNAIIGFAEILADAEIGPRDPGKQREYAGIIQSSAAHLLSVVNLILDMSKIEAGEFKLEPESFDFSALIASCCDMLRLKAEAGGVAFARGPRDGPVEIFADKRACRQILLNLASNAVKFTKPGGRVDIRACARGGSLLLEVADDGIGIAEEHLPRLGEAFFQARSSYDRMFEGTGLGLSLVRGLVGLHGGSMSVESVAEAGTCVTICLPLKLGATGGPRRAPARIETAARLRGALRADGPTERASNPFLEMRIA